MSVAQLRQARLADATAIAGLHLAARRDAMPWLPALHSDAEVRAWIRGTLLPRAEVWVAEIDGRLAGYLALVDDMLDHLYVAPGDQGRGIGSLLLDQAKALRPAGFRLYAFQRNRRACEFYEARGLVPIRFTDGAGNEENEPDVLYRWTGDRNGVEE